MNLNFLQLDQAANVALAAGTDLDFTWLFVKMISVLGVVSLLALIILKYVIPKWHLSRPNRQNSRLTIVERFPLTPKSQLWIIDVEKRRLLIGATESSVNLITDLTES